MRLNKQIWIKSGLSQKPARVASCYHMIKEGKICQPLRLPKKDEVYVFFNVVWSSDKLYMAASNFGFPSNSFGDWCYRIVILPSNHNGARYFSLVSCAKEVKSEFNLMLNMAVKPKSEAEHGGAAPPERTMELCKAVMDYLGSKLNGDISPSPSLNSVACLAADIMKELRAHNSLTDR